MKKLIVTLSSILITSHLLAANLDLNSGDTVTIMANQQTTVSCNGNGGGSSGEITVVKFFNSDNCNKNDFITEMKYSLNFESNLKRCATRAESITQYVWSVEINGVCSDISHVPFLDACKRFL